MKDKITQQFDSNDEKIIGLLRDITIDQRTAAVCVALKYDDGKGLTQQEIQEMTGVYQSDISISLKLLVDTGYVEVNKKEKGDKKSKGRPKNEYAFSNGWDGFISALEYEVKTGSIEYEDTIKNIKEIS